MICDQATLSPPKTARQSWIRNRSSRFSSKLTKLKQPVNREVFTKNLLTWNSKKNRFYLYTIISFNYTTPAQLSAYYTTHIKKSNEGNPRPDAVWTITKDSNKKLPPHHQPVGFQNRCRWQYAYGIYISVYDINQTNHPACKHTGWWMWCSLASKHSSLNSSKHDQKKKKTSPLRWVLLQLQNVKRSWLVTPQAIALRLAQYAAKSSVIASMAGWRKELICWIGPLKTVRFTTITWVCLRCLENMFSQIAV